MNKKSLTLTFGGAVASTLLTAVSAVHAGQNPFALIPIDRGYQLAAADEKAAEGSCSAKMQEGKTAEGKCGAGKMQADKAKEASCGANKKADDASAKMPEGKCGGTEKK